MHQAGHSQGKGSVVKGSKAQPWGGRRTSLARGQRVPHS